MSRLDRRSQLTIDNFGFRIATSLTFPFGPSSYTFSRFARDPFGVQDSGFKIQGSEAARFKIATSLTFPFGPSSYTFSRSARDPFGVQDSSLIEFSYALFNDNDNVNDNYLFFTPNL